MHDWNIYLKGSAGSAPDFVVLEVEDPIVNNESGLLIFHDNEGKARAVFPLNAVAATTRVKDGEIAAYPVEQTDTGTWIRNVRTDGQGHWVPYTGPLYGVRE